MGRKADEFKEALARRAQERTEREAEMAPEVEPEMEDEEGDVVDFEDLLAPVEDIELPEEEEYHLLDEEEMEDYLAGQIALAQETGFEAYLSGQTPGDNPFDPEAITEGELPPLATDELLILAEGWESGWFEAHREAWTADVLLTAKHLTECEDGDQAALLLGRLEQGVQTLADLMDFKAYEEFWGFEEKE